MTDSSFLFLILKLSFLQENGGYFSSKKQGKNAFLSNNQALDFNWVFAHRCEDFCRVGIICGYSFRGGVVRFCDGIKTLTRRGIIDLNSCGI